MKSALPNPAQVDAAEVQEIRELISSGQLRHVAFIMDGNRRWASEHHKTGPEGHYAGFQSLKTLIDYAALAIELPVMTVYAFSTENWRRSETEVGYLMKLFETVLNKELGSMIENNVQLKFLGDRESLPAHIKALCEKGEAATAHCTGMRYQVAWNYGGRAEIVEACRQVSTKVASGELKVTDITESLFAEHLYDHAEAGDPDLMIRTGGESRISNYLLWQLAYSELAIIDELWPEFTPQVFNRCILDFKSRQRRFGK